MTWPRRRSRSPSSGEQAAARQALPCRGCTGSPRICFGTGGGPSGVNYLPTAAAGSTAGQHTTTRRPEGSTVRFWTRGWRVLSRRCAPASGTLSSSTRLAISASPEAIERATRWWLVQPGRGSRLVAAAVSAAAIPPSRRGGLGLNQPLCDCQAGVPPWVGHPSFRGDGEGVCSDDRPACLQPWRGRARRVRAARQRAMASPSPTRGE